MPSWKDELLKECNKAYHKGGEVKIIFIRRQDEVIPIVYPSAPPPIRCDVEKVVSEED